MEFPNLGEHCALSFCNQLDFLPFTCDACKQIYCRDHVKYEEHQCEAAHSKDRRVPVCPLCNQPISLSSSELPDRKVNEHIDNDCKSDLARHKRSNRCNAKGCKQRELIPVLCVSCKLNFCLRHRHENDHSCIASGNNDRSQSTASVRAGQAAADRFSSGQTNKPKTRSNASKKQSSSLNSLGADLNSQRNERLKNQSNNLNRTVVQPRNMSEDEALALALQASLSDSPQVSQQQSKSLSEQEMHDAAFAQALVKSEEEERERQMKQNKESTHKNKDGCLMS